MRHGSRLVMLFLLVAPIAGRADVSDVPVPKDMKIGSVQLGFGIKFENLLLTNGDRHFRGHHAVFKGQIRPGDKTGLKCLEIGEEVCEFSCVLHANEKYSNSEKVVLHRTLEVRHVEKAEKSLILFFEDKNIHSVECTYSTWGKFDKEFVARPGYFLAENLDGPTLSKWLSQTDGYDNNSDRKATVLLPKSQLAKKDTCAQGDELCIRDANQSVKQVGNHM
jgi:hypothetical protein